MACGWGAVEGAEEGGGEGRRRPTHRRGRVCWSGSAAAGGARGRPARRRDGKQERAHARRRRPVAVAAAAAAAAAPRGRRRARVPHCPCPFFVCCCAAAGRCWCSEPAPGPWCCLQERAGGTGDVFSRLVLRAPPRHWLRRTDRRRPRQRGGGGGRCPRRREGGHCTVHTVCTAQETDNRDRDKTASPWSARLVLPRKCGSAAIDWLHERRARMTLYETVQ